MTTYNTYQEAKIANPESNIYIHTGEFWCEKSIRPSSWTYESRGFKLCNPADYCMTVEKFLADGYKFVKSDVVFDFGDVVSIDTEFDVETYNKTDKMDDRRYILRAVALEEKKPRTKVEYVKCEFKHAWEALKSFEEGEELYRDKNQTLQTEVVEFVKAASAGGIGYILTYYKANNLYRRIETTMTEREAFVEALQELWIIDGVDGKEQMDKIVDSGLFKLVNHDSNRLKDKIRAVAEWEMNTSNNHDWESVAESIYCAVDDLLKS